MIAIISSLARERAALVALCASRGWISVTCESVHAASQTLRRCQPHALVVRHSLSDGFSDHVLAKLAASEFREVVRSLVLLAAGTPAAVEARQISLGADCTLRDPIRTEVLLAYLEKFQRDAKVSGFRRRSPPAATIPFAGGVLHRLDRELRHRGRATHLTPREIELVDCLVRAEGEIVTYETLFGEILNRPFQGDSNNMRVLLAKLAESATAVGLEVRDWVEVIPKAGYRYRGI